MSALSIQAPFPVFQDRDGLPLDNGYVWVGTANLNPQTNPAVAYYDSALTIVAAQPLRTLNGFISRAGTPAQVYVDGTSFSILVQDSKGSMVYSFADGTGISPTADGIVYDPAGTGAVPTTVQAKLRESISVKDFGAVGDGVTDDTVAIQSAVAAAKDKELFFPPGTYIVNVTQPVTVQVDANHYSPSYCACQMSSGLHMRGIPGQSIVKMKNNIAVANGRWYMFLSNTADSNLSFVGMTFDLNGQNNAASVSGANHMAALFWSGAAACPSNLFIDQCIFKNGAGLTTIGLSFSIVGKSPQGNGFTITNSQFIDNGFAVDDHSSIYCTSGNTKIIGNKFTIPTQAVKVQNAIEIHAAYAEVASNIVANYVAAFDIVSGDTGTADTSFVSVHDNKVQVALNAVYLDRRNNAAGSGLHDIDIYNNEFEILDVPLPVTRPAAIAAAITLAPAFAINNVKVSNNRIIKGSYVYKSWGVHVGNNAPGTFNDNIIIDSNFISGFTVGVRYPGVAGTGSISRFHVTNNVIIASRTSTTPADVGYGIAIGAAVGQSIQELYLENNKVLFNQYQGVDITGTVTRFRGWNNTIDAGTNGAYSNIATITDKTDLNEYKSGTFTPNQGAGLVVVGTFASVGRYVKIGNLVHVSGSCQGATSVSVPAVGVICSNLPYAQSGVYGNGSATNGALTTSSNVQVEVSSLYATTAIVATGTIYWSVTYHVNS